MRRYGTATLAPANDSSAKERVISRTNNVASPSRYKMRKSPFLLKFGAGIMN